jgi:hypothetical protein
VGQEWQTAYRLRFGAIGSAPVTVAVSCNLSDGVVLAVDSAVTLPDGSGGIAKVYENASKLFQLGERPIGIAAFGIGALGTRSVGSYVREFETLNPGDVVSAGSSLADVVEGLRAFFLESYQREVVPLLEQAHGAPFEEIADEHKPVLGLVVGGFSAGAFLSEVWEISIPIHAVAGSAVLRRNQGDFGTNWFAMFDPIRRYIKGFDPQLIDQLVGWFVQKRGGQALEPEEISEIHGLLAGFEYQIPFAAMPLEEGIQHTRFLAELVVSHHRYAVGAPVVGGAVRVGSVTYRGGRFDIHAERA